MMNDKITYSSYLSKIQKLKKALDNHSWNRKIFFSKFQEIINIFLKKGITACADLLDPSLIKMINSSFPCYKGTAIKLYKHIYNTLNFKGNFSQKKREEFYLDNFKIKTEREPTKREKLFDKIIPLYYQYNNYLNKKIQKNYFLNTFVHEIEEIKTLYFQIRKEDVDNDSHIYDQFDKEFYKRYITLFELIEDKFCLKEEIIKKKNLEIVKGIPLKMRTFFYNKEKLIYGEDNQTEYKNYSFPFTKILKEQIKRQICGFLNSQGGRIFIGISDDKIVNGISMNYHERDAISNDIINLTYDFYPKCRTYINVNFIPIKNINDNKYIENLYIIKIIVSQGETKQLYSCTTKGFNSYLRLQGQCINLTAEEIRYQLFNREKNSDFPINPEEFKDPIPENPELIKSKESLNNQLNIRNLNNFNVNYYEEDDLEENEDDYEENDEEENGEDYEEYDEDKNEEDYDENDEDKNEEDYDENDEDKNEDDYEEDVEEENEEDEVEDNEENSKINIYTIKINVIPLADKPLTRQNLKTIFSSAKCKKKFFKEGKKFYGYLNFTNKFDAILFHKNFNYKAYSYYQIKLIPKY